MTMKALPPALRFVSPRELGARLEAERRGTPFLLYLDEGRHQHIVELAPGTALTIGREPDSEVRLDWDSEVSRALLIAAIVSACSRHSWHLSRCALTATSSRSSDVSL